MSVCQACVGGAHASDTHAKVPSPCFVLSELQQVSCAVEPFQHLAVPNPVPPHGLLPTKPCPRGILGVGSKQFPSEPLGFPGQPKVRPPVWGATEEP